MSTNEIDASYLAQAQNVLKRENATPEGVKVEQAASLFSAIKLDASPYKGSKVAYIKSADTDGNGYISEKELASVFQRADKEGRTGDCTHDKIDRNNQVTDADDITCDFAKHGSIPYLLEEAKAKDPEKYEQIKQKLTTGSFTITGDKYYNLFEKQTDGREYANAVNDIVKRYEALDEASDSKASKLFLDKLVEGQVAAYDIDSQNRVTFVERSYKDNGTLKDCILDKQEVYDLDHTETPISRQTTFLTTYNYEPPKTSSLEKDPFEITTAQKINTEILTDEKMEYYNEHILEAIDDPKKFAEFIQVVGKDMKTSMNVTSDSVVAKRDMGKSIGVFNARDNLVEISYKAAKAKKEALEQAGVPKEKMKQELTRRTVCLMAHEYFHAKQWDMIHHPPENLSPEERIALDELMENNSKNHLAPMASREIFGSDKEYIFQPIERGAYDLEVDVQAHMDDWYARKDNSN